MTVDGSYSSVDEDGTPLAAREVQQFANALLKGIRFRGTFVEKRYVTTIKAYRSVIHIWPDEEPLIRILTEVKARINKLLGENNPFFWIGFTRSNDQCFLLVNLSEEILGEYLFNIRGFEIDELEAKVRLRQVRPKKESTPEKETTLNGIGSNFMDETVKPIIKDFANDLGINLRSTFTFTNIKDASTFMIIAFIAFISAAFYTIKYLLEFTLRFTRELSMAIKCLTPTMLSLIDLLKYFVFGFFWVIMALFRPSHNLPTRNELYKQQSIGYYNDYNTPRRKAIQYRNPNWNANNRNYRHQGVKITEVID